jgi:hypothetical protein
MGLAAVNHESLLQSLQENYRCAFRLFTEASAELLRLQGADSVNLSQIQDATVRIRDTQTACRDARDKLAGFLLAKRRETLLNRSIAEPTQFELLNFVRQVESLLAGRYSSAAPHQNSTRTSQNVARALQA